MPALTHRNCGGLVVEDLGMPPYEDDTGTHPVQVCHLCGQEILGDLDTDLIGLDVAPRPED